jgi:ribose-phosphate pyrophosphokinase
VQVEIEENVRKQDVFVIQPTCAPSAENLMELLVLIDALKRASVASVTAVVPYFGYSRQDRRMRSSRVPITAKVAAKMFSTAGADRVLTVDLHADQIQGFFDIPVDNVYASPLLLADIWRAYGTENLIVSRRTWAAWSAPVRWPSAWMTPTWRSSTSAARAPTSPP